ncbi:hypothetical protein LRP88_14267 [Fusarium phalaenopsidis]
MEKDQTAAIEKADDKFVEHAANPYVGLSPEEADFMRQYEGQAGKKVIDFRLIPIMAVLYLLAHIDQDNIGNAKIEGMDKNLGLTGNQYNIASTIFFVPYIIFEIPSSIILKKVRPSIWLSFLIIAWGIVMTCMGVVKNFHGLVACRVVLGVFEAGFFPGAAYIVSTWYPRHELQQRLAIFYTASAFSGALSGLLAFGIARMNGARGIAGWRWIFLLEGAITVAAGLVMPLLIIDTPERAKWLSGDEKRFIDLRLHLSGVRASTEEGDKFSWKLLFRTMVDWKILLGIILAWANSVPNAAFRFTMPQIIKQLGMAVRQVLRQCFANVADSVLAMYTGVVLAQIGIYPLLPGISAWTGNNLAPSWKRSIGLAWLLAAGNLGSIIGTNIFLDREGPRYATGYGTSLGTICLGMATALVMEFFLWRPNKVKAQLSEVDICQKYSQEELDSMGEKSPLHQYTL